MSAGSGPGRRLTGAEEERAAVLYRGGASTRDVARELAISNSSAQRVRVRLRDAGRLTPLPAETPSSEVVKREDPGESTVTEHDDQAAPLEMTALPAPDDAAELEKLTGQREELVAEVAKHEGRAEACRLALVQIEAERSQRLAEDIDAQDLRPRLRDAADDQRDELEKAGLVRGRLAQVDAAIVAVQERITIAALGAELAEAIKDRDAVLAKTGDRQRQAVTAVKAAAEEFCQVLADERAAVTRVEQLAMQIALGGPMPDVPPAVSTALQTPPDVNPPLPFQQAMWAAGLGETKRVAVLLGEVFGWLPPDPAVLAAERDRVLALRAALVQPPAPPQPPAVHMDPRFGASHGVDEHGNALPPPTPAELERRGYPAPARPAGWLGGQPWPG